MGLVELSRVARGELFRCFLVVVLAQQPALKEEAGSYVCHSRRVSMMN